MPSWLFLFKEINFERIFQKEKFDVNKTLLIRKRKTDKPYTHTHTYKEI